MNEEFKKINFKNETRYVLESASAGATSSGAIATINSPQKKIIKRNMENLEVDHEVEMAREDLHHLVAQAIRLQKILSRVSEIQGLEGWQQAKITKASDYINSVFKSLNFKGDVAGEGITGGLAGGAIGAALTKTPSGAITGYKIGSAAQDLLSTDDETQESVAGPEKCWPGYRKVGTKPGTGKNAGKRVNDCEKIKEDYADDLGDFYAIHPDSEEAEEIAFKIMDLDDEEDFVRAWTSVPNNYQEHFGYDIPLWGENDMDVSSYPNMIVKRVTFDQYVKIVGDYLRSEELSTSAMSKMKKGVIDKEITKDSYFEHLSNQLAEKIPPGASVDYYIKDFSKSNAPQFKGKSQAKRKEMAIAAHYAAQQPKKSKRKK